jgi:hypothetical protein
MLFLGTYRAGIPGGKELRRQDKETKDRHDAPSPASVVLGGADLVSLADPG